MSETKLLANSATSLTGVKVERDNRNVAVVELIVTGTGSVSATAQLFGSVDGSVEQELGSITASGTGTATANDTIEVPWRFLRAVLSSVTGTGAVAICTHSSS